MTEDKPAAGTEGDKFAEILVTVWSKAVDTQMHFNEMSVKSRQLGLTFVAAALGLAVFLFSRSGTDAKYAFEVTLFGCHFVIHVAEFIVLAAGAAVYAVRLLDLGVYHMMLRGAVAFGEDLEELHLRKILGMNKGMTEAISHFSRHTDAKKTSVDGKAVYSGSNQKNAYNKISRFYTVVILFLVTCAVLMFVVGNDLI